MDWMEDPKKMRRMDLTVEKIEAEFTEWGFDEGVSKEEWDLMEANLDAIIQAKSELKSQAGILWKRASNGILAWIWINAWYMETTGMGISQRRGRVMCPTKSKSDDEVMYDVEKWRDEMKELVALGQEDLGAGFKITALKMIATDRILKELETEERRGIREQKDHEEIWEDLYAMAMNISKEDWLGKKDVPVKKSGNAMDVGLIDKTVRPPGFDQDWDLNMMMGKGKGGKGKGGKGGTGYQPYG